MSVKERSKLDMKELEKITENIERDYKPVNIELTSYEQEQEANAIISYDELVEASQGINVPLDDDLYFEKVNLKKDNKLPDINVMSYEHEEAFLNALKKLQSDLIK